MAAPAALAVAVLSGCAAAGPAPGRAWPARFPDADTVQVTTLEPGVRHVYLWLPRGPWAVHVLEVDGAVCAPRVAATKAGPPLAARATVSTLAPGAVAALNADFFMLPAGTPVGPHVHEGRVLAGPGDRPAYALDREGRGWAGPATLVGWAAVRSDSARLSQVNRPVAGDRHHPPRPGLTLFDEWSGPAAPADPGGLTVLVRPIAGRDATGVVVSLLGPGASVPLDGGHAAFQAVGDAAAAWLRRRTPGDTVAWRAALEPAGGGPGRGSATGAPGPALEPGSPDGPREGSSAAVEAVGGFPVLVAGGRGVYAEQPGVIASFGAARHPRSAVAWDVTKRRVLWVVVDGRQAPYSDGMSLPELEALLLRLGAKAAINLDGGGSTALAIRGRVANRPSDEEGERPVANVLALQGCGTPPRR